MCMCAESNTLKKLWHCRFERPGRLGKLRETDYRKNAAPISWLNDFMVPSYFHEGKNSKNTTTISMRAYIGTLTVVFFFTKGHARVRGIWEGYVGDVWRNFGRHLDEFWRTIGGNLEDVKRRLEGNKPSV